MHIYKLAIRINDPLPSLRMCHTHCLQHDVYSRTLVFVNIQSSNSCLEVAPTLAPKWKAKMTYGQVSIFHDPLLKRETRNNIFITFKSG